MPAWLTQLLSLVGLLALCWNIYAAFRKEGKDSRAQKLADDLKWRESRLAAEKALADGLALESKARADADQLEARNRVEWQLKREAELASIAGILGESTEVQKLVAGLAATQQAHSGEILQINSRMNLLQQHVNNLTLTYPHAKP